MPVISMPSLGAGRRPHERRRRHCSSRRSCRRPIRASGSGAPVRSSQLPTHSNDELGNENWGLGPSFVVLHLEQGDPWVYGVLVNNIWSVGSSDRRAVVQQRAHPAVRQLQLRRTVLYLTTAPDPHRRLEGRRQPAVDRAARRWRRQDLPLRQAAGEHADLRRTTTSPSPTMPRELAAAGAGPVHVPEMKRDRRRRARA